jgi:hypothetical protein
VSLNNIRIARSVIHSFVQNLTSRINNLSSWYISRMARVSQFVCHVYGFRAVEHQRVTKGRKWLSNKNDRGNLFLRFLEFKLSAQYSLERISLRVFELHYRGRKWDTHKSTDRHSGCVPLHRNVIKLPALCCTTRHYCVTDGLHLASRPSFTVYLKNGSITLVLMVSGCLGERMISVV